MKKVKLPAGIAFLLMAMTVTKRVVVVLDFPDGITEFIPYSDAIHQSMSSSSYFTALGSELSNLNTLNNTLQTAETGVNATLPTATTAQRDVAWLNVQNALRGLRMDVQVLVDADIDHAEAIVAAANMKVKQWGPINKQNFEVRRGPISGTAKLIAKGRQGRYSNDWEMSADGTNWTRLDSTLQANALATGLTPTQTLDFRHRYILKDGPTDWLYFNDYIVT